MKRCAIYARYSSDLQSPSSITDQIAFCRHGTSYRRERLEASLREQFRAVMTPRMIEELARQVNAGLAEALAGQAGQGNARRAEFLRLESQDKNLAQFIAEGGASSIVRDQLRTIEQSLDPLRAESRALDGHPKVVCPTLHPAWVRSRLEHLAGWVQQDPIQAKAQIAKHLDGDLTISSQPSRVGEKRAEIAGRVKQNSLLRDQKAVCLQMVARTRG